MYVFVYLYVCPCVHMSSMVYRWKLGGTFQKSFFSYTMRAPGIKLKAGIPQRYEACLFLIYSQITHTNDAYPVLSKMWPSLYFRKSSFCFPQRENNKVCLLLAELNGKEGAQWCDLDEGPGSHSPVHSFQCNPFLSSIKTNLSDKSQESHSSQ